MKNIVWVINGNTIINNDMVCEVIKDNYNYSVNNISNIDTLLILEELLTCIIYSILTSSNKQNKFIAHKNYYKIYILIKTVLEINGVTDIDDTISSIRVIIINNNIHLITKWSKDA